MHNKNTLAHMEAGLSRLILWLLTRPLCCPTFAPAALNHQVRLLEPLVHQCWTQPPVLPG